MNWENHFKRASKKKKNLIRECDLSKWKHMLILT